MTLDPDKLAQIVSVARQLDGRDRADYLRDVTQGDPAQLAQINQALAAHGSEATQPTNKPTSRSTEKLTDPEAQTVAGPPSGGQALSGGSSSDPDAPTPDQGAIPTTLRRDLFKLTEQPGSMVGRYKLLQKIGEGGFGAVYMAEQQEPVRRRVALKIIKAGMDTRQVIARFEAERQALAMMDHPYIAKVLDAGATDAGRPYFVMELVKGVPVTEYCDQAKLDTRDRLALFKDICSAIQHAHQKGIIHRDLKPSNIMVTLHGGAPVVKVIDFGIAKATDQRLTEKTLFTNYGQMIGTPAYMSPEQAVMSGLDVDTRSDVYSLGVLLYELLAGRPPLDDKTLRAAGFDEMRRLIREQEPPKPSTRLSTMDENLRSSIADNRHVNAHTLSKLLRGDLDWIVMKALEKDRGRRYESASAFSHDIDRYLKDEPVEAAAPSTAYRLRKYVHRHKGPVVAVAVIALLLVAGTAVSTWQAVRATRAEALAQDRLKEVEAERNAKEKEARDAAAIAAFFGDVLRRPDPRLDGRTITVVDALDRAGQRIEEELKDQPLRRARLRVVLGRTYDGLGLYDKAIEQLEKARDTLRSELGADHPDTLAAMQRLAMAYHDTGKLDQALKLREEVLAQRKKSLGPEHAQTLAAMNDLATSYYYADQHDKTIVLYQDVLRLGTQSLGPEHELTLDAMTNLANLYHGQHRQDEALVMRERVLPLYEKTKGLRHPDTLAALNNLATSYAYAGHKAKALALRERVTKLSVEAFGEDHSDALLAQENLASSYHEADRFDEALALRERVLKLRRQINGPAHPYTLRAINNLAISCSAVDQSARALSLREEMRDLAERTYGTQHKRTLVAMHNLGNSYQENDRWDESLVLRQEVLQRCRDKYGDQGKDTLWAMDSYAITLSEHGQTEEAVKLWEQAHQLHPTDVQTAFQLAALYAWLDRADDFEALREKTLANAGELDDADEIARVVRLVSLRPMDAPQAQVVLVLARRMDLAKGREVLDRAELDMALGLAEYRAGNKEQAFQRFTGVAEAAAEGDDDKTQARASAAGFYRALCLSELGRTDEARKQYASAQSSMKPLPTDGSKPLAGLADFEKLMQWLAYREARLRFE